jgi:hypothetical protein
MPSAISMAATMLLIPSLAVLILLIAITKDIVGAAVLEIGDMIDELAEVLPAVLSILATTFWLYFSTKGLHQRKIAATLWQLLLSCLMNATVQIETAVAMPIVRSSDPPSYN